ncbi:PIG-L deacetylase family protein [Lentzea californiensis]|uniref:PIG-L deacetylase family protein n=1 Tax=Lentzea californiensis TaxID=438851 RepID=UPI00216568BE|nr:PIG-L family deacetylase [Lentzea californiensis]MCR3752089.1 GlcNAc-PI de-N-acetylase [Lentzea californiensis]
MTDLTVLAVAARAGDAELGMGMRLRWYADRGAAVHVHCLAGEPDADWRAAIVHLGLEDYTFSGVTRGFAGHRGLINAELFRVVPQLRPDVVYGVFPGDHDPDRRIAGDETEVVALREARDIRSFRCGPSDGFRPTLFFLGDDELMEARRTALTALGRGADEELARLAYREHVHHRVIERMAAQNAFAEMFTVSRAIEGRRR